MKELTILLHQYLPYLPWYLLVFIRIFTIIYLFPFLGGRNVPWQAKSGLAGMLSVILCPLFSPKVIPLNLWLIALGVTKEFLVGFTLGFIVRLIFDAIQLGGQFIGYQMGFAIVNVIDPYSSNQISIIAQFKSLLAILIFLTLNGHYILIAALVKSFSLIPVATTWVIKGSLVQEILRLTGGIFAIAIKISAPVLVALLLTNIALGLIARTMPQINVFIVGFPLEIGIGFFILGASLPFLGWCYKYFFIQTLKELEIGLRLMGG